MYTIFGEILGGLLICVVAIVILNRRAAGKLLGTARAAVGEATERLTSQHVMVNFRQRLRDQQEAIKHAVPAWEKACGLVRTLTRQIASQDREWTELDQFLKASVNLPGATAKAVRMATLEKSRELNREQLALAQSTADKIEAQIAIATTRLHEMQAEASSLDLQVEFSQQMTKLSGVVGGINLLDSADSLQELREAAYAQIDKNQGKLDVSERQSLVHSADERETEREVAAQSILARYEQPAPVHSQN